MGETWVWSLGWEDPLEESMATHSSILVWRIPWTEEAGRLQSVELQRVGHNWVTNVLLSFKMCKVLSLGFPGSSNDKKSACNGGDLGLIPGLERSPGGGHGNPLLYSYLGNSMDRGAWRATVHGVAKSRTGLSDVPVPIICKSYIIKWLIQETLLLKIHSNLKQNKVKQSKTFVSLCTSFT